MQATIWEKVVTIPTYEVGEANAHPMFFENRVYQGSSGKVYPYPIIETVRDTKKDKAYTAVFMENDYLKVMVLPELGGRIHRIVDKTNGEDAVYHNEVIKPALVGLLGPWISGGIEFNWPQHHRPTTFMPVEYRIRQTEDLEGTGGQSVSIQLSDSDRMYGTKAIATITLHQDQAYVEITGHLYNPTQFTQTFLWWANPAIAVNNHTQSIFPPDVHAVMDHGKRDVSTFPIATGIYYKHDYSKGVDISRYKNIPVPTSYMAYHSDYDFVGSYDHQKQTGILHVADHHISPGKKQWTWGCGDFGKAWDRNLTDENGPYIELMTGVFTDNQPDFTFLQPGEEKTFTQYFLPFKRAPRVINATKDLLLSCKPIDTEKPSYLLSLYAASDSGKLRFVVAAVSEDTIGTNKEEDILFDEILHLQPTECFEKVLEPENRNQQDSYTISLFSETGERILFSTLERKEEEPKVPDPAKAIPEPETIETVEELYLAAVHLEQYRHATFRSEPYYLEGLKRDPEDYRCNTGYGELLLKRGLFAKSERLFRTAIQRATKHNPNPIDSKAYTLLGLSLFHQERYQEAYDAFYKAIWDGKQQEQGFLYLGILEIRKRHYREAVTFLSQALTKNGHNLKVRDVLALAYLLQGNKGQAKAIIAETLKIDQFDTLALDLSSNLNELFLIRRGNKEKGGESNLSSYHLLSLSTCYGEVGMYEHAFNLLPAESQSNPMIFYHKAYYASKLNRKEEAQRFAHIAESLPDSTYFPNTLEDLKVLQRLAWLDEQLWKAPYLLGTYWYDKREDAEAKKAWERANTNNPKHAKTLR
ncbi:MAG: DUF5107 domain-containing protein, partial [Sphaerochaetaceae bacterium]